ncbi:thioesterase family protein [Rhodococcus sp. 14-2470-1b]|jgi:acyl-CoA thioesterase FadM|uniref:acyl-CoA thioesterase n=1 Tax=Rhodococcus sp. 14-2470-1b TaxID=2023149 RepID=UPI0020CF69CD|nr:hotdog domain-containing protein [Rhodococcus sp. 14-2470-1b]
MSARTAHRDGDEGLPGASAPTSGSVPAMYRASMQLTHRPARDGSTVDAAHVPAYLALELASQAWADALSHASDGRLTALDVMVVNVTADFSRELFTGGVDVDVTATDVGRTSITVRVAIEQGGERAAVATFVLVHVVDGRAERLTDEQRAFVAPSGPHPSRGA